MKYKLGRKINHDPRSKQFAFNTADIQITNIEHKRFVPVFDQGQVGSCTGNAGNGVLNTNPFLPNKTYTPDEKGALEIYSAAEKIDGGQGYPPEDQGSSGLSIAKVLSNAKLISGYQHTFTLNDALKALMQYPIITGTNWYSDMFTPDPDGRVHPTGTLEGGHEYEAYKVDVDNGRIWFYNSWGTSWGVHGTFYMTWADYHDLLLKSGDVTVLIPPHITPPAPIPAPQPTKVTITRGTDNGIETIGTVLASLPNGSTFSCNTLERPWKNNTQNISCVPKGNYLVKWVITPRFPNGVYQLQDVPGRVGIDIHSGNYFSDSDGCILLGVKPSDINHDGQIDVTSSVNTVNAFNAFMNKQSFTLTII